MLGVFILKNMPIKIRANLKFTIICLNNNSPPPTKIETVLPGCGSNHSADESQKSKLWKPKVFEVLCWVLRSVASSASTKRIFSSIYSISSVK